MQSISLLTVLSFFLFFTKAIGQVGIGTPTPNAAAILHVNSGSNTNKGLLVNGLFAQFATVPDLGEGPRLMFYPGKAAFRAGYVSATQWDNINVGKFSVAMGGNVTASGENSVAMGHFANASGYNSTAIGQNTIASGTNSIAFGQNTIASGYSSTAMGYNVNTNNQSGALIIGDSDPLTQGPILSGFPDEFVARFNNGYYFLTSGNGTIDFPRMGVRIGHNGNAWLSICDKNRKENFEPLDGEDVLQKISTINLTSWNYKMQDPKTFRHYGIMAQDFYSAFGHDKFGTIGNDTTVNPIDMIGIDMTAIQALEKRTENLKAENERVEQKIIQQQTKIDMLETQMKKLLNK